jgi:excinuclease ABC subunit C
MAAPAEVRQRALLLPAAPGVYRFRSQAGRLLYIGRAVNLRRRVLSYWGDLRDRPRLRRMVAELAAVEAAVCESEHEAAWLERNLLERYKPRWNKTVGGQELPCYIRLDRGRRIGLSVVFGINPALDTAEVAWFGPYLGSARARAAVAGLDRLLPVRYATSSLTASERDMARVKLVSPGDRAHLLRAITAVLNRVPDAVEDASHRLRTARAEAVGRLAFETAARIQSEIEGLEWVTTPQRVRRDDGSDVDVAGWSSGLLVRFEIRSGVLRTWTTRETTELTGRRRTAVTPSEWVQFADRNARLAAQLAGRLPGQP